MQLLGAEVIAGRMPGSRTLKDAINEAIRDWVTNVRYHPLPARLGAGPASLPADGARLPGVIGARRASRFWPQAGRLPDLLVACVGGGSNAIGLFHAFVRRAGRADRRGGGRARDR